MRVVSPIDMCKSEPNGTIVVYIAFYFVKFFFRENEE